MNTKYKSKTSIKKTHKKYIIRKMEKIFNQQSSDITLLIYAVGNMTIQPHNTRGLQKMSAV